MQLLKDDEGLALIAKVAELPLMDSSVGSSVGSPSSEDTLVGDEGLLPQNRETEDYQNLATASAAATAPTRVLCPWIATSCDQQLTKHLFFLYWTWIHPAHRLFSMEGFLEDYDTGNEAHCSSFLVAAICAAACDFLGPLWTSMSGRIPDVAALRRDFVAEATFQEILADRTARTWLEASHVMLIVNPRLEVSSLMRASDSAQYGGG